PVARVVVAVAERETVQEVGERGARRVRQVRVPCALDLARQIHTARARLEIRVGPVDLRRVADGRQQVVDEAPGSPLAGAGERVDGLDDLAHAGDGTGGKAGR